MGEEKQGVTRQVLNVNPERVASVFIRRLFVFSCSARAFHWVERSEKQVQSHAIRGTAGSQPQSNNSNTVRNPNWLLGV